MNKKIVIGVILLMIIAAGAIFYFGFWSDNQSQEGEVITNVTFEELWNRLVDWPEEFAIRWNTSPIKSIVHKEEYKKGDNWVHHTYNEDYPEDERYAFLLDSKAYTCSAWGGEMYCNRAVHDDPEESNITESTNEKEGRANRLLESYYSLPIINLSLYLNPRNIGIGVVDYLRRIIEKDKGIEDYLYQETLDTMEISKIDYGDINCYFFELTSVKTEGLAEMLAEWEDEMNSDSITEEEKQQMEWTIETMRYGAENPVSKVKLCFNQNNILTYEYLGDNPPDTINELEYFSPTVEDESVFELPLPVGPVREDIVAEGDASQCKSIEDFNDKVLCVIELAVQNNDPTICNQIQESNYFYVLCFDAFVRKGQGRLVPCKEKQSCGGVSSKICAIPEACLDDTCENTLEADGFACYEICSKEIECPYPGADPLIKPVCGNYEIGGTGNYNICI